MALSPEQISIARDYEQEFGILPSWARELGEGPTRRLVENEKKPTPADDFETSDEFHAALEAWRRKQEAISE